MLFVTVGPLLAIGSANGGDRIILVAVLLRVLMWARGKGHEAMGKRRTELFPLATWLGPLASMKWL
jgi:hypothetical protein